MKKVRELHPLKTPDRLQQKINIDIIELLPKSNNKDITVVIVDRFSKMIRLKTMNTTVLSEKIAKIYQNKFENYILSDSVSQFASKFINNLIRALDMKRILPIAYHSQTNGQIE